MTRRAWLPPTAPALARWHRLHGDAVALLSRPLNAGGALARSALAVRKDVFPSRDRDHWPVFGQWIDAASLYAAATPLERSTQAEGFLDLTRWAGIIMGLETPTAQSLQAMAPTLRHRADLDG